MENITTTTKTTWKAVRLLAILTVALGLALQSVQAHDEVYVNTDDLGWLYLEGEFWAYCFELDDWIGIPANSGNWIFLLNLDVNTSGLHEYYSSTELVGCFMHLKTLNECMVYVPGINMVDNYGWVYICE